MRWGGPNLATRDNDGPDILRVDNCSEIDMAGNFYIQDGKYYDKCYDFENEDAPEDANLGWLIPFISCLILIYMFIMTCCPESRVGQILFRVCRPWTLERCYNTCCAPWEPQPVVRNDNNASISTISTISNISTISANIRQPPSRPPSPSAPPLSEIQEDLFDRLPRSKASENQCAGQSKYFF